MQGSLTVEAYLSMIRDRAILKIVDHFFRLSRLSQLSPLKKETYLILFVTGKQVNGQLNRALNL